VQILEEGGQQNDGKGMAEGTPGIKAMTEH
jgi:hypothetical protein